MTDNHTAAALRFFSDVRAQFDICTDCLDAIEFTDHDLGVPDGTVAALRALIEANEIDPSALHQSTFRLSSGEWENVPSTAFSTSPCDACGSRVAGERHAYDYLPGDN